MVASDFRLYCAEILKCKHAVTGATVPMILNKAQLYLQAEAEAQIDEMGMVRLLALKGRQVGCTQWVAARYFNKVSLSRGKRVYVLAHEEKATQEIFDRMLYMHERCPDEYRPEITRKGKDFLDFGYQDGSYRVATAGAQAPGRSQTVQYFHWSEVAYSPNAEEHRAGALQTVPDAPGTEIILESTSAGFSGLFYDMCMEAQAGEGWYKLVFCPWWWEERYRTTKAVRLSREVEEYAMLYGLDEQQAAFFHLKNVSFGGTEGKIVLKTKREYPATIAEAFEADDEDSFILSNIVVRARKTLVTVESQVEAERESILGVDVGRTRDPSFFIDRLGRTLGHRIFEEMKEANTMRVADRVAELMHEFEFDYVFIDMGGIGAGVVDRLEDLGLDTSRGVWGIDFGGSTDYPDRYVNKRAEMYGLLDDWLRDEGGVSIRDDDRLHGDICAVRSEPDAHGRTKLEIKDKVKKRLGRSPNRGDGAVLTFGRVVRGRRRPHQHRRRSRQLSQTSWMAR